jgi:hypothetical protein
MALDKTARMDFKRKIQPYLQTGEFNKVAEKITPYVRVRLYEDSFADRILAVRQVPENELIPRTGTDDSYYVISNIEQGTEHALVSNFRGRAPERYLGGPRYEIPVGIHETPIAQKSKNELLAYNYDLLADAAEKDVQKLGELRDSQLLMMMNDAVALSGKQAKDVVDQATEGPVQIDKVHINRLASTLQTGGRSARPSSDILKATRFLFNDETRSDFSLLDYATLGHDLTREVFVGGFTEKTLQGIQFISSIKFGLLTEEEAVTLVTFEGAIGASSEDVVVAGVTFTVAANTAQADIAADLAAQINASADPAIKGSVDGQPYTDVRAEAVGGVLRVIAPARFDWDSHTFTSRQVDLDVSGLTVAPTQAQGFDRYDILWAFPDAEFIGEIIRVAGRDIEPEIWKTPGEQMINRTMREWFGMGIGNYNGVAKLRMQRSRFLG